MKKIIAIVMALVMMMAIAVPSFAAVTGGSNAGSDTIINTLTTKEDGSDPTWYTVTIPAAQEIFWEATATEIAIIGDGTSVATPIAGKNGLTGTFDNITAGGILVDNYIIAQNQFWTATAENYLNAYRAYIVPSSIPTTEPAEIPGRRRIAMGAAGENEATGLDNITTTDTPVKVIVNGQLIIIREGVKYNVQGVRL